MVAGKRRLDQLLVELGHAESVRLAEAMIRAGEVLVDSQRLDKPGILVADKAAIRVKQRSRYVSRGGLKLEKALDAFNISVSGLVCADLGASTGGFTDCLLQRDAAQVFAVDVGYGQLAWSIRQNPRVMVIERFNARNIHPEILGNAPIDFAVLDLSFISLTKVLPAVQTIFPGKVQIVALIKPQFELPRDLIGSQGVVTDTALHDQAILSIRIYAEENGLTVAGVTSSPILGPKGNREFLIYLCSS